jgi:hypothetical protein
LLHRQGFKRILVAVDWSELSLLAPEHVARIAKQDGAASSTQGSLQAEQRGGAVHPEHHTGKGILIIPEGRLLFYNMLSEMEKSIFTTAPKEGKGVLVSYRVAVRCIRRRVMAGDSE